MAKVASSSIYRSIKNQTSIPVFHIHTFSREVSDKAVKDCKQNGILPDSRPVGDLIYHYKILPRKPLKIITCVREPIARNISAFFDAFEFYTGTNPKSWNGSFETLSKQYHQLLPHEFPLNWFDNEFHKMTSIDIYQQSFNPKKKFNIYKKENIEILLLRTDLDNLRMAEEIGKFLNIHEFKLNSYNVGENKAYAEAYKDFKQNIKFKEAYVSQMLNSKYTRHFFSGDEITELLNTYNSKTSIE